MEDRLANGDTKNRTYYARGASEESKPTVGITIQVRDSDDLVAVFNEAWLKVRSKIRAHETETKLLALKTQAMDNFI